jgi:hypothetical protein
VTFDLLRYSYQVCLEICDHLKIQLFRIPVGKSPPSSSTVPAASTGEKNGMGGRSGGRGGRGTRRQQHH